MKLKKIASLMLAGVMAVSMLAGCEGNTTPDPDQPETPVVTNGVSADVKARIAANDVDIPEYVTFADDTDLDEALTYAVQYAGVKEVADGYINVVHQLVPVINRNINNELAEAVSDYTGVNADDFDRIDTIGNNETLVKLEENAGQAMKLDDGVAVAAYVVSGEIEDMARNEMIAKAIQDEIEEYQRVITDNALRYGNHFVGGNFKYSYEVSVSVCEADANSVIWGSAHGFEGVENPNVTFVAVQVVRTAEAQ